MPGIRDWYAALAMITDGGHHAALALIVRRVWTLQGLGTIILARFEVATAGRAVRVKDRVKASVNAEPGRKVLSLATRFQGGFCKADQPRDSGLSCPV